MTPATQVFAQAQTLSGTWQEVTPGRTIQPLVNGLSVRNGFAIPSIPAGSGGSVSFSIPWTVVADLGFDDTYQLSLSAAGGMISNSVAITVVSDPAQGDRPTISSYQAVQNVDFRPTVTWTGAPDGTQVLVRWENSEFNDLGFVNGLIQNETTSVTVPASAVGSAGTTRNALVLMRADTGVTFTLFVDVISNNG